MCDLMTGLIAAQTAMQLGTQYSQSKAQREAYEQQAKVASWNKAAEEHKAETTANSYAQKQSQLNDKYKLAVANARAQYGSSGLDSTGASLSDVLDASSSAYTRDSNNLLANQREDEWASYVKQVNYQNEENAYNTMAKNTKKQFYINALGTLASGAASIYGGQAMNASNATGSNAIYSGNSLASSTNNYNFASLWNKKANYGLGGIMP